jgi:hypothetical protein
MIGCGLRALLPRPAPDPRLAPLFGALQLVAQHHEFEVLVAFCPSEGSQYLKSAARDEVAETEGHDRRWLTTPKKASSRA